VLTAVLVCSATVAVVATVILLFHARTVRRRRGDRGLGGDLLALALPALPAVVLPAFGASTGVGAAAGAVCVLVSALWLTRSRRWTVAAHLAWSSSVLAGAAFLAYTAAWTLSSGLGPFGLTGGVLLWLLELCTYLLSLAYLWELVDVLGSRRWARRMPQGAPLDARTQGPFPFVSIHVPTHNEPPEMVLDTLRSLLALDYPDFEVVVLDNNTDDPALWQPVERFCAEYPATLHFHHLADWPGYKSGALNFGLTVTDPRAELVAVVDADYLVDSGWLRATAPLFAEPDLGFVQSPQDYRGWQGSSYYRRLYHSYDYFFRVSQRSRDERDAAIFGGTMGLIRRSALQAVGGWDEWCITEDAELSLRLQKAGWTGRQVDDSWGQGVMPLTWEALKSQRFRWCFGGIQILRLHWRSLLPWNRDPANGLTRSQRLAYLCGGLQWFGELLGLALLMLLFVGAIGLAVGEQVVLRRLSPLLLVAVPAITGLSLVRAIGGVRGAGHATWREAAGALTIWLGLGLTVARACVRGATEPHGVFLRTPKTRDETSIRESMQLNRAESVFGVVSLVVALLVLLRAHTANAWLVGALLALAAAGYLSAPVNSMAAMRADLPDRLRRRRSTEASRMWTLVAGEAPGRRVALVSMALAGVAAAVVALAPPVAEDSTPELGTGTGLHGALGGRPSSSSAPSRPSQSPAATGTSAPAGRTPAPPTSASVTSAAAGSPGSSGVRPTSAARPSSAPATTTARPATPTATPTAAATRTPPGSTRTPAPHTSTAPAATSTRTPPGSTKTNGKPTVAPTATKTRGGRPSPT
jgi:cellulose synthase/poly-beta-1,6-N-acetylglucosamine synthase-like glycosyltransferase